MLYQTIVPDQHVANLPFVPMAELGLYAMDRQHLQNIRRFLVGYTVDPDAFAGDNVDAPTICLRMGADNGVRYWWQ